jgi:hypothetical protein
MSLCCWPNEINKNLMRFNKFKFDSINFGELSQSFINNKMSLWKFQLTNLQSLFSNIKKSFSYRYHKSVISWLTFYFFENCQIFFIFQKKLFSQIEIFFLPERLIAARSQSNDYKNFFSYFSFFMEQGLGFLRESYHFVRMTMIT